MIYFHLVPEFSCWSGWKVLLWQERAASAWKNWIYSIKKHDRYTGTISFGVGVQALCRYRSCSLGKAPLTFENFCFPFRWTDKWYDKVCLVAKIKWCEGSGSYGSCWSFIFKNFSFSSYSATRLDYTVPLCGSIMQWTDQKFFFGICWTFPGGLTLKIKSADKTP